MEIFQALQTPRRREILRLVWDTELSAGEISRAQRDVTFGAVSQHLRILESAGLVTQRKEGTARYYTANKKNAGPFRKFLEEMWKDSLYRLKLRAELEEARRGPRSTKEEKKK